MPIRNQNWYDLQANRRYPLDERSTGIDDNGGMLRDNILVDCHIRFPSTLGQHVFVQGITISPALVTIVFGVSADLNATSGATIAAITAPRDTAQNVNLDITPLQSGVAGWAVLGPGIEEEFVGRYSTPLQTLVAARNARPYRPLPVPTLGKLNAATSLQGLITMAGTAPVTATYETFNNSSRKAIVFRLEGEVQGYNPLEYFADKCGQRPESRTCPKPAIETINGIAPDCDGNINIEFEGFTAAPYLECGGIDIIGSIGLSEACNQGTAASRKRYQDACNPDASSDDQYWYNPIDQVYVGRPVIDSSQTLPSDDVFTSVCKMYPLCASFESGAAPDFRVKEGLFVFEQRSAPAVCGDDTSSSITVIDELYLLAENGATLNTESGDRITTGEENSSYISTDPLYNTHYVYAAAGIASRNVSLFKDCEAQSVLGHTVKTEIYITPDGIKRTGGIVLNYLRGNPYQRIPTTYVVAVIDCGRGELRLLRFNGSGLVNEQSVRFLAVVGKWYRLSVKPVAAGQNVLLTVSAESVDGSVPTKTFSVPISQYGDPTGHAGLFTDTSYAYFNKFSIEAS